MTIRRRTGLILVGIGGTLLIVFVFVVLVLLSGDRSRSEAISYLEKSTGKKVEIGRLAVTFFPRITIHVDDLAIKSPPLFPPSYILKVARVDAQIDPWSLLHRLLVIRSLVLEQPVINLVSDPDGPWNFENPVAASAPNSFPIGVISLVKIKRGHVIASNLLPSDAAGPVFFEAHEISSELANVDVDALVDPASTTLDGLGTLKAALLRFGSLEAKNLSSNIRLQARQVLFTDVNAETYGGNTTGELSIKLSGKNPSFKTDAKMKRIDVAQLLSAFRNARGKMTGEMDGELKIAGEIEHTLHPLESLHGTGHLTVRDGQVPSLKLNANLMKLAHYNDLVPPKMILPRSISCRPTWSWITSELRARSSTSTATESMLMAQECEHHRLRRAELPGCGGDRLQAGICDESVRTIGWRDAERWQAIVPISCRWDAR